MSNYINEHLLVLAPLSVIFAVIALILGLTGLVWLIYLSVRKPGKKGPLESKKKTEVKETEKPSPAAKKAKAEAKDIVIDFTGLITTVVILSIVALGIWLSSKSMSYTTPQQMVAQEVARPFTTASNAPNYHFEPEELPGGVALPIICGCESNGCVAPGKQFKDGTNIPLPNEENGDAIGMCQILSSVHEKKALEMGYDIRTEDGNWGYAVWLYNNDHGTKHWETDPRGKWHDKLMQLAIARGIRPDTASGEDDVAIVDAGKGVWGNPVKLTPTPGKWAFWRPKQKGDIACKVRINMDDALVYDCVEDFKLPKGEYARFLEFMTGAEDVLQMRVYLAPPPTG